MLGHKSAVMTLDQYGHLFGDRLDVVADAMDALEQKRSGLGTRWAPNGHRLPVVELETRR